jgi:L-ribulose-5-phosphate 3-epimerase
MQRIGIMQGRLLPPEEGRFQCFPRQNWMMEFGRAAAVGLDSIEWIYDVWGENVNPIRSEGGIERVRRLIQESGIDVVSLCADYFMERPLIRVSLAERQSRLQHLIWLISRCQLLDISRIVLPFVDNSSIQSDSEIAEVITTLQEIFPVASEAQVEIHLETSLGPVDFGRILSAIPSPALKVNYDIGNSASLGYDCQEEFSAYGSRIGSVHIKDRIRGGGTVPLGSGDADIPAVLVGLNEVGYSGDFILQVARGEAGREVEWGEHNRGIVLSYLQAASEITTGRRQ